MAQELAAYLKYTNLENAAGEASEELLASLVINRQESANAFNGELLVQLQHLIKEVAANSKVRVLLLQGHGKHFSAGADLHWMKSSAQLDKAGNLLEAEKLMSMFEALVGLKIPTIAVVKGAAYGGAVGLIAACDYALALDNARFCLSEVKIGLLPAVILPYLGRKMQPGLLRRAILTGDVFSAEEALAMGLVQKLCSSTKMEVLLQEEINLLLAASPEAQSSSKQLFDLVSRRTWQQGPETVEAIAKIRVSRMGQQGLGAFFQKCDPPWRMRIAAGSSLYIH
ncbi:MAG: enoyl-CoA hydratase-related protein [Proteobacteria bacterium]|nr:enoyl-CoA hydratase-related protein [Pseudomonadota bacterium]